MKNKIDFGNCTNITNIEREWKVSTAAGYERFNKMLCGYPTYSDNNDKLYRFMLIDGKYCSIDEEIADLIQILNDNDFPTMFCCAGHRTEVTKISPTCSCYITFKRTEHIRQLLSSIFREITGESLEHYKQYDAVRVFSNKKYQEHSQQHVDFLELAHQRKYIVLNNRKSFFIHMSFERETTIRFSYKPDNRMYSLNKFEELISKQVKFLTDSGTLT